MDADWRRSVAACAAAVHAREVSVEEIARWTLDEIRRSDPDVQAFTFVEPDAVVDEARGLDRRRARGEEVGALAGVPVGVKDLFDTAGLPTSYGSGAFEPYVPDRDSHAVERVRRAGALVVGKTRTSELAWSTVTPPTANPADHRLVAGGSSGGSGAAVGAGLVLAALGTDTGGSIRIPAALCGVVGIKPTYGVVGRRGVLPVNWSLDAAGPLARTVADARAVLAELAVHDPGDPASARPAMLEPLRRRLSAPVERPLRDARLGVLDEPLFEVVEEQTRAAYEDALALLEADGAQLVHLRMPECEFVPAALLAIDLPEGAAIHTELLRDRAGAVNASTAALLHFAPALPGVLLARGHQARREIARRTAMLFREHALDALVAPANAAPAIPSDSPHRSYRRADGEEELALWAYARVCWFASLTGQPAVVVPAVVEPAPVGIQLIGKPFHDDELLSLGAAVEAAVANETKTFVPGR